MKKEEIIKRNGEAAWEKQQAQRRAYYQAHKEEEKAAAKKWQEEHPEQVKETKKKYREAHPEQESARVKKWQEENPEQVIARNHELSRKGGKYYDKQLKYNNTGLRRERRRIRSKHGIQWRPFKNIIAPESQIHHEWIPKTPEYRGVALVEKEPHQYGIVDVIEILDGKITLLTEAEVKKGKKEIEN